eukprot:scaffold4420_cov107-Cylindrotheca_fusiformis.AAC.1
MSSNNLFIDLTEQDSSDHKAKDKNCLRRHHPPPLLRNPYLKEASTQKGSKKRALLEKKVAINKPRKKPSSKIDKKERDLQAGLVFEEHSPENDKQNEAVMFAEEQEARKSRGEKPLLYHDPCFGTLPSSIEGVNSKD